MKLHNRVRVMGCALLCAGIAGCAQLNWPPWLSFTPPPQSRPVRYVPPAATELPPAAAPPLTETTLPPRRLRKKIAPVAPPPPPAAVPTVTLVGVPDQGNETRQILTREVEQLQRIDRSKLNGAEVATYDQASGFVEQAQQALKNRDYIAASGFAAKASLLTSKLVPNRH